MLHLQCHFGQDSLSWARIGAKVTGVDFSDEAINTAIALNAELGIDAKFICSNIFDLYDKLDEKFDIVFTSYGTISWLPELTEWGELISSYLKPGGIFYTTAISSAFSGIVKLRSFKADSAPRYG